MRRFLTPKLALLAGLAALLTACSGESPTAPNPPGGGNGGGACNVTITLATTADNPFAGGGTFVRATVKRSGAPVADGTSVVFTTDFGFFFETGLPTVSKTTVGGVAEVTLGSLNVGASHVRASVECATALLSVTFKEVPGNNPFISSIFPTSGSCAGGETVTINGGRFGTGLASTRVTFGGKPATVVSVSNTQIVVLTPAQDRPASEPPDQRDAVDLVVTLGAGTGTPFSLTVPKGFSYFCVQNRIFISSVVPSSGSPNGGEPVVINGGHFGTNVATTRVTFCGVSATIVSMSDNAIAVLTPRHQLADPAVSETCDVGVTVDLGLVSQQQAIARNAFTYRGTAGGVVCNVDPGLFIATISPNSGSPNGGESVTFTGGGFGTVAANTRVEFGGAAAQIISVTPTAVVVTTPRHVLANPNVSEVVDVVLTRDVGGQNQACVSVPGGFTFRGAGPGGNCPTNAGTFITTITPNTGGGQGGTVVTIAGAGFTSSVANTRVEFGGVPGTVTAVTPTSITVTTPQHILANPSVPEPVTVRVIVDSGGANQVCASQDNGFVYTQGALQPTIFSSSPRTGPNDASTRVTIFGTNFQFPIQVFVTGGSCGAQIEAQVVSIKFNEVVFLTPIALNGNSCLANSVVTITVTNPYTGKTASCPDCFKYYACPVITTAGPNLGPYLGGTRIVINGENFEDPSPSVVAGTIPANLVSVSSSSIVVITNPLFPINSCADVTGPITVKSDALTGCAPAVGPSFTYLVKGVSPLVFSISPDAVDEGGGPITINGANFIDPHMQVVFNFGTGACTANSPSPTCRTVVPTSITPNSITVTAPPFIGTFQTKACTTSGGTAGTQKIPTAVGVTVVNPTTTCTGNGTLIYNPTDNACNATAALAITSTAPPAAVICSPYNFTFTASGGTPPYSWSLAPVTAGLSIDSSSGLASGTPRRSASGVGTGSSPVTVTVTDSSSPTPHTAQTSFALTDPDAPLDISGNATQTIAQGTTSSSVMTVTPSPTPGNFTPITWTIDSPPPGFSMTPTTGQTSSIAVALAVPPGPYSIDVRATDSPHCGGSPNTVKFTVSVTVTP
jgi:hypothetical protein